MIPRKCGKNARRLCFIFLVAVVVGGVENRPVDQGEESAKKGPFMATKWAQNGVILGLDLDSVGYIRLAHVQC